MAGLIDFHATFVPNRYTDQLQRRVGLLPLTGPIRSGPGLEADVVAKTLRVVDRWRPRIQELGRAGWAPFAGDGEVATRNRIYAANCVPSFMAVEGFTRHCGRAPCPFCWSRRSLDVWDSTIYALFESPEALHASGPDASDKFVKSPFDLILMKTSELFQRRMFNAKANLSFDTLPSLLRQGRQQRVAWFQWLMASQGVLGGFSTHLITPDHANWRQTRNFLLVVPVGFEPDPRWFKAPKMGARFDAATYRHPGRKAVLAAVAKACRYASSWMTDDPAEVVAILDARANLKLSAKFGLLRNRSCRARAVAYDALSSP